MLPITYGNCGDIEKRPKRGHKINGRSLVSISLNTTSLEPPARFPEVSILEK